MTNRGIIIIKIKPGIVEKYFMILWIFVTVKATISEGTIVNIVIINLATLYFISVFFAN